MSWQIDPLESRTLFAGLGLGLGSTGIDFGTGIATDSSGNFYVTGSFQGKVDFKPGTKTNFLTAEGQGSAFVAKYDSAGGLLWVKMLGSLTDSNTKQPFGVSGRIAVDASGNVYTTGLFNATTDFAPSKGTAGDIYVVKLDTNGNTVWQMGLGSTGLDAGAGIALNSSGDVFVTGAFSGTVDFEPGKKSFNLTSQGQEDAFIAKYDPSGKFLWAKSLGGITTDVGIGVAVNSENQPFVVGAFQSSSASFSDGVNPAVPEISQQGLAGGFIMKLSAGGSLLFCKSIGGSGLDGAGAISVAVDSGDDIFVGGAFEGTVDFDPSASAVNLTAAEFTGEGFLSKFSGGACVFLLTKRIGGSGDDAVTDIKITKSGYVFASGFYHGNNVTVSGSGSANLTSKGKADQFIGKFRISGKFLGAKSFGGTTDDWGVGLALDPTETQVYMTGFINGTTGPADFFDLIALTGDGDVSIYRTDLNLVPV